MKLQKKYLRLITTLFISTLFSSSIYAKSDNNGDLNSKDVKDIIKSIENISKKTDKTLKELNTGISKFDENNTNISPINGTWKPKIKGHKIVGCPPMMKRAFKKEAFYSHTKKIKFSKPFHPNDMFNPKDLHPKGKKFKWKKVSENKWHTILLLQGKDAGGAMVKATWDLTVTSETSMNISSHLTMKFPKEMARFMGGSSICKVNSFGIIKRIGK